MSDAGKPTRETATQRKARAYSYRLLRYSPTPASDEFYNIAALLYDEDDRLIDARFTPDFDRMRCHPAVELPFLEALRTEFEEQQLLGEGFERYLAQIQRHLSTTLQVSDERVRLSVDDPIAEMERLVRVFLATPSGLREGTDEPGRGSRAYLRGRMRDAFDRAGLFLNGHGLQADVEAAYLGKQRFTFDFGHEPRDGVGPGFVHALGSRNQMKDATQLAFVLERLRVGDQPEASLDVVFGDELQDEAREVLVESRVALAGVDEVEGLAGKLRERLGL